MNETIVMGIDPGSQCTGWGIVAERSGVLKLVACGTVRGRGDEFDIRIGRIFTDLHTILARHKPLEAAIENVFAGKSAASALKLGQARGAAIAALGVRRIVFSLRDYLTAFILYVAMTVILILRFGVLRKKPPAFDTITPDAIPSQEPTDGGDGDTVT